MTLFLVIAGRKQSRLKLDCRAELRSDEKE